MLVLMGTFDLHDLSVELPKNFRKKSCQMWSLWTILFLNKGFLFAEGFYVHCLVQASLGLWRRWAVGVFHTPWGSWAPAPSPGCWGDEPGPRHPAFRLLLRDPQMGPSYDRLLPTQSKTFNMEKKKKNHGQLNSVPEKLNISNGN